MMAANVSQAISLAEWRSVFCVVLTGVTVITCLLLRTLAHVNAAQRIPDPAPTQQRGPHLRQVYPANDGTEEDGCDSDVDIIAIHGLDTDSEKTWTWEDRKDPTRKINWLKDSEMLPSKIKSVRIFTCDWPADLLQPSNQVQKTHDEHGLLLLEDIQKGLQVTKDARNKDRPILFIASCLGGIILIKALVDAEADHPIKRATRGIIFLATPFRGTSFQDVAVFAEPSLQAWGSIQGREVSNLLSIVKGSTPDLDFLVRRFVSLCNASEPPYLVFNFYEKGKTSLPSKIFPWLPAPFRKEKQLVDRSSATLDIVRDPVPLNRPHSLMNKFSHIQCTDKCEPRCAEREDFELVCGKIQEMLQKIREGSPLEQADASICNDYYNTGRLNIERLSGELLPLKTCYVNLAIVENSRYVDRHKRANEEASPKAHSFSLNARLNVNTPNKALQVDLPSLFNTRKDTAGQDMTPRRILIRGRAGIGKSTLCKKMVHEFKERSEDFRQWHNLFDRILWIPLRRLKDWPDKHYGIEVLFSRIFFAEKHFGKIRQSFAEHLALALEKQRTLFVLDGWDEIAQEFSNYADSGILQLLFEQANVIVTSRPLVSLPKNMTPFDLELETVGFYPPQVEAYLQSTFSTSRDAESMQLGRDKASEIQTYLQAHQLIQDLVRIPIQLDALCYTWENFRSNDNPQTMTAIYRAIELNLWKKDIVRLQKTEEESSASVTVDVIKNFDFKLIEPLIWSEISFLETLAFAGLYNDLIDFDFKHRTVIYERLNLLKQIVFWERTLPQLSFLRSPDASSDEHNKSYHFLHLTFQEYFAARYFVRQWRARQPIRDLRFDTGESKELEPIVFLHERKYDPRFDIFWRFVAGLIGSADDLRRFFQAIEQMPRDLVGLTHQRLVMHCLSEVEHKWAAFAKHRAKLEAHLRKWLLYECDQTDDCHLAREMECSGHVLVDALKNASEDARFIILRSLRSREVIPVRVNDLVLSWLRGGTSERMCEAIFDFSRSHQISLADEILERIVEALGSTCYNVRSSARKLLQNYGDLPNVILRRITILLQDTDTNIRWTAIEVLKAQKNLTHELLQCITRLLNDGSGFIFGTAIDILKTYNSLTDEMLQRILVRLEDTNEDEYVKQAAIKTFQGRANLTNEILQPIAVELDNNDMHVRCAAIAALKNQSQLAAKILQAIVADTRAISSRSRRRHRRDAINALQMGDGFNDKMLQAIAAQLDHESGHVRTLAEEILGCQKNLTIGTLQTITSYLGHQEVEVRYSASFLLIQQSNLNDEILKNITEWLEDTDKGIRKAAIRALQGQTNLNNKILQRIVEQLKDADKGVRKAALWALQGQTSLTDKILQRIAEQLRDADKGVRKAALWALQGQTSLTDKILQRIAERLMDTDKVVREIAIRALRDQTSLDNKILHSIAEHLEDIDENIRWEALRALQGQTNLTDEILQRITERLEDRSSIVFGAAVDVFKTRGRLTSEILQRIAERLSDEDAFVRATAIRGLQGQANITEAMLRGILSQIEHSWWHVRNDVLPILGDQSDLTEEMLQVIAGRFNDEDKTVRRTAFQVLQGQSNLSDGMLRAIIARLNDVDGEVREAAMQALLDQRKLDHELQQKIAARLAVEEERRLRPKVIEVLQDQDNLDDNVLRAIVACLDDSDRNVQQTASEALIKQATISPNVLRFHLKPFYKHLLQRSFSDHLYWYGSDESFIGVGLTNHILECQKEFRFSNQLREVLEDLGVPTLDECSEPDGPCVL